MGFLDYAKTFLILASILSLFGIGTLIAMRSGTVTLGGDRCRLVLGNLSHLVLDVAATILFLLLLQQMVGVKLDLH